MNHSPDENPSEALDGQNPAPDSEQQAADARWEQVSAKHLSGANWFFWIAGLSIVNSLIALSDGDRQFIVGLGISQFVVGIALGVAKESPDLETIAKIVAVVFTVFAAAVFTGIGVGGRRRWTWIFIVGMVFYTLDGLLYLVVQEWLPFAFHIFVLTRLFVGFQACRELNAAENQLTAQEA